MSDATNAATTSTPNDNLRTQLRAVCTVNLTNSRVVVMWSKWSSSASVNRDLDDPSKLRIVHIETAIKEAMDRLAQSVWDDYMAIEELMEQK